MQGQRTASQTPTWAAEVGTAATWSVSTGLATSVPFFLHLLINLPDSDLERKVLTVFLFITLMQTLGVIGLMKNEKKLDLKILCALFIEKEVYFLLNGVYLWISTNLIYH